MINKDNTDFIDQCWPMYLINPNVKLIDPIYRLPSSPQIPMELSRFVLANTKTQVISHRSPTYLSTLL